METIQHKIDLQDAVGKNYDEFIEIRGSQDV